jgi:DNA-binding NarL/FixJ family response regulator
MNLIRILIVDDSPDFLSALTSRLNSDPECRVVAEAKDGEQAIEKAGALHPDIVLMDIAMPILNGVEATRQITQTYPDSRVIMLTASDTDESLFAAVCVGARGYIVKGADKAEILKVIRAVHQGEVLWGRGISEKVLRLFARTANAPNAQTGERPFPELTARELQVLELIARGVNNAEIAERLFISPHTVRNHITNILSKLQVRDRAQAIVRARDAGLGR